MPWLVWFRRPGGERLRWLLAPSVGDLAFAVRSSLAAALSLLIAMWMELDSPQWAPLTVWVVAQSSRGESLSKARWRIAGTVAGCFAAIALVAAFPQASGLFFVSLALWIGLCCGFATFFDGYRSYGLLVASFTSTIVATGAIIQPDEVFDVAMSRGTYIILGIVCEATLAMLFMPGLQDKARARLLGRLEAVCASVSVGVTRLVDGRADPEADGRLLAELMAANGRIEFDVLEMAPQTPRLADHARAAIADLLMMLARARGVAASGRPAGVALERDFEAARVHVQACLEPVRGDRFRFRLRSRRHAVEAVQNGLRACAGIIGAWLVWEVTAWPAGVTFVSMVSLVYGLLATREVPLLASAPFFRGAVWCAVVAGVFAFLVIPAVTAPECLVLALLVPMTIGGLAARNTATAGYAFSFNMFLPVLIGPSNMGRFDEISFLNGASAFLAAVLFARLTFGIVLPFRADAHVRRTRVWTETRLRAVADLGSRVSAYQWLSDNADSMVRTVRTAQGVPREELIVAMRRHLEAMTLGMQVIAVRQAVQDGRVPAGFEARVRVFLRAWERAGDVGARPVARALLRGLERRGGAEPGLVGALAGIVGSGGSDLPFHSG
nr:FUSC family protein [Acetobacter fallax]